MKVEIELYGVKGAVAREEEDIQHFFASITPAQKAQWLIYEHMLCRGNSTGHLYVVTGSSGSDSVRVVHEVSERPYGHFCFQSAIHLTERSRALLRKQYIECWEQEFLRVAHGGLRHCGEYSCEPCATMVKEQQRRQYRHENRMPYRTQRG